MAGTSDASAVRYMVTANVGTDSKLRDEYLAWLKDGHVQAVVDGGATSAEVILLDGDGASEGFRIVSSYLFPNRAAYDKYVATVAPKLREEGKALFGTRDVSFSRMLGEIQFATK